MQKWLEKALQTGWFCSFHTVALNMPFWIFKTAAGKNMPTGIILFIKKGRKGRKDIHILPRAELKSVVSMAMKRPKISLVVGNILVRHSKKIVWMSWRV